MQIKYGPYAFDANGCTVVIARDVEFSEAGQPFQERVAWDVEGILHGDSQADVVNKVGAMDTALRRHGLDLVLNQDSGQLAAQIRSADTVAGTRVSRVAFPQGKGAEFSTYRTFQFRVEAELPVATFPASGVLEFSETLELTGGLPLYRVLPAIRGANQRQLIYPITPFRAVQSGRAVGWLARPNAPAPLFPAAMTGEGSIRRGNPQRQGRSLIRWPIEWSYEFESVSRLDGEPNFQPF